MTRQGTKLGAYTLHELINSGGMSEIWLGTDAGDRPVAVRLMRNNSTFAFTERKRFLTGCEVLHKVSGHPLIIGYVEHGKIAGELALVMEYVEGGNLKVLMTNQDPVFTENVAEVLIQTATSLEHLHDRGFMHLDFKPENVLLTRNGGVRLIDFDLAQPIPNPPRKLGKNPGTPHYMAPEQLLGEPVDHRADMWAWGVSAYELLTSHKPFPGDTPEDVLRRQLNRNDFIAASQLNAALPSALERIVSRCLERSPDKRYPIMSVLVHELKQALCTGA